MKNILPSRVLLNKAVLAAMVPALLLGSVPAQAAGKIVEGPVSETSVTGAAVAAPVLGVSAVANLSVSAAPADLQAAAGLTDSSVVSAAAALSDGSSSVAAPAVVSAANLGTPAQAGAATEAPAGHALRDVMGKARAMVAGLTGDFGAPDSAFVGMRRDFSEFKLGKQKPLIDPRAIRLENFRKAMGSTGVPDAFDFSGNVKDAWGMDGNDTTGDCTIACVAHMIKLWTAMAGNEKSPTEGQVLQAYSLITGYDPRKKGTDNGAQIGTVLEYWRTKGIFGDKIDAYASVSPKDFDNIKAALYTFEGVYLGVALPISAQNQDVWDVVKGRNGTPGSWGGHAIPAIAYGPKGLTVVTWGALKQMTWAFLAKYSDEAHAILDESALAGGKMPSSGFDLDALKAAIQKFGGSSNQIAKK